MPGRIYSAYYNEIDSYCVEWLRNLMRYGLIPNGVVDDRPIQEVSPDDLEGYTQCHFFAGLGGWPYALRLAGWPDDRPVWTGSCPCPSFSAAGKGQGFDDPRHLWPHWHRLIRECRPPVVFGEQVDAAIGYGWLDLVQADMEAQEYAVGKAVLGACSVGAPHKRQRLFFVAESASARCHEAREHGSGSPLLAARSEQRSGDGGLADRECTRLEESAGTDIQGRESRSSRREQSHLLVHPPSGGCGERGDAAQPGRCGHADCAGIAGELGDAGNQRLPPRECEDLRGARRGDDGRTTAEPSEALGLLAYPDGRDASDGELQRGGEHRQQSEDGGVVRVADAEHSQRRQELFDGQDGRCWEDGRWTQAHGITGTRSEVCAEPRRPGPVNGFWRDADWLFCRDGKWRAVAPGAFPLAHGIPSRVGRLRAYGNAIVPQVAAAFVRAYLESMTEDEDEVRNG